MASHRLRAVSPTPTADEFFGEAGLITAKLGAEIQRRGRVCLSVDGRLARYVGGVYRLDGDAYVRVQVREILGERFRRRHVDEVVSWLRASFATLSDRPPARWINTTSGLLDWQTEALEPHTPDVASTIQIPVAWNAAATCPAIDRFLGEVLPEDAVDFVIGVIGYALYIGNPFRVAILFLGPGWNGKSVLLAIMKHLLGPENVSNVPLQVLAENRFAAAELFGKIANICGDLDARAIRQTDTFKMLTGGDPIFAERKHCAPFSFTPFALPIFSANEPPLSSDQTEAWFDRWLVIPMERRIPEDRVDPHLAAKLTTPAELEGLLVKAVRALRRLMARGRFELPPSIRASREQYRERLDTVAAFVAEACIVVATAWTPRPALYGAYREWSVASGRLPVSAVTFNEHLRRGFAGRIEERVREGTRGWLGVGLLGAIR